MTRVSPRTHTPHACQTHVSLSPHARVHAALYAWSHMITELLRVSAAREWEDPGTGLGAVRGGAEGGASGSGAQSWGVSAPPRSAPLRPRPVRCAPSLLAATPAVAAAAPAVTASEVGAAERAWAMPKSPGPRVALLGSLQGGDRGRIGRGRWA